VTPVTNWEGWAAGLFEGEGCIEISGKDRLSVRLRLNTTDHDVLERFAAVVGCGKIREVTAPSIVRPHWKTCWAWAVNRQEDCRRLLETWRPYLGVRRAEKAGEALSLLDEQEAARWRTCYCGTHFRANRGNQWACSAECRTEWQKVAA